MCRYILNCELTKKLCDGRNGSEPIFILESFRKWLQKLRIPLARCNNHVVASDLRKFAEQYGDVVGWNKSNRAYILTHGVRGIEWSNYRHPLPENVYDVYMQCWKNVKLSIGMIHSKKVAGGTRSFKL